MWSECKIVPLLPVIFHFYVTLAHVMGECSEWVYYVVEGTSLLLDVMFTICFCMWINKQPHQAYCHSVVVLLLILWLAYIGEHLQTDTTLFDHCENDLLLASTCNCIYMMGMSCILLVNRRENDVVTL